MLGEQGVGDLHRNIGFWLGDNIRKHRTGDKSRLRGAADRRPCPRLRRQLISTHARHEFFSPFSRRRPDILYITQAAVGQVSKVWFDDVVVATEYIGPLVK